MCWSNNGGGGALRLIVEILRLIGWNFVQSCQPHLLFLSYSFSI